MAPQMNDERLLSLDFFRGFIMALLTLESTGLFEHLLTASKGLDAEHFLQQFFHHPWNGLRFWDLIQPGFMFIAGAAMAFSLSKQKANNIPWNTQFKKIGIRCSWLFFWGVLDYAVRPSGLSFELWDVLTQLSVTTLIAFLVFQWSLGQQLLVSVGLLLSTELLYRFTSIPDFDQPFTDQHNFGNYLDLLLMHKINSGGWVAINCIPTAAHTIWGSMAGKLLLARSDKMQNLRSLLLASMVLLILGYSLGWTITPIIKRIATSSFTIVSGGWCLLGLAICYWWIDVNVRQKNLNFFTVFGKNSLFIYLFFEIVGTRWFNGYCGSLTNGLMEMIQVPTSLMLIISSLVIFLLEWAMCFWLNSKKIYFRV